MDATAYTPRLADSRLAELVAEFPAVLISGPRAAGKTTTAAQAAAEVVRLDRAAQAGAFQADPDAALRNRGEPLLLDEWQEVPGVLGAVRRAVDEDGRPGRFILTGSVRAELEQRVWAGTGRVVRMAMHGLTEVEVQRLVLTDRRGLIERLATATADAFVLPEVRPQLPDYIDTALRGGFPEVALRSRSPSARDTWLDSYLGQLLTRDAVQSHPHRDSQKMRRYFEVLALSTAGMPSETTLYDAAGVNAKTAAGYDRLFADLYITEQVPAWATNRLARLTQAPKRYIVDPALAATAGAFTASAVMADGDLIGRVLDTFATAQLRVEAALARRRIRLHHLRTRAGRHEVDLIVEQADGSVLGIEYKASAAPTRTDARHLIWLRDELGDRFVAGAVLHTGPDVFVLDERIFAVPLCAMWGP